MKKVINNTGYIDWKNTMINTITEIKLKKELNLEIFQQALNDALIAYPRMAYSCMVEDGKLYCIENNLPLEVQVTDKPLLPNGGCLNDHLISFTLWQNTLTFVCNHTLTDGTGVKNFMSFLMQRYAELIDGNAMEITGPLYDVDLMNEEIDISKLDYPKDFQPDPPLVPGVKYPVGKYESAFITDSFRVNEDDFMRFVKEKKTSPSVALGALMAKQILNAMPENDLPVNFDIVSNLRQHVGLEKTMTNCVNSTFLSLSREDMKQENYMETMRATLKRRNSPDYVRYVLREMGSDIPRNHMLLNPAFCISYTGKADSSNSDIVEKNNIYRMVRIRNIIEMKAQNGWFNISIANDNPNNPLTDMLKNAFREIGLEIYEETKTMVTPENGTVTIKTL